MALSVKLEVFEGPLDLLLHLIEKNKIDIYDIPIAEITEQYLEYVSAMESQDLDVVSDFLLMAATLLDIKTRMLLPAVVNEDGEEEDPRQELVQRLLEYKMYKYISGELREYEEDAGFVLYKEPTIPDEVSKYVPPVDLEELLADVDVKKLTKLFQMVIKKQKDKIDPIRSNFSTVQRETFKVSDKIINIINFASHKQKFSFTELLEAQSTRVEIIVTFLAVLELMKMGKITLNQEGFNEDIMIEANEIDEKDSENMAMTVAAALEGE
ncbi:MAG: segregation/condensation protein A [Lachnospiraceae bacterium]|nr:segregation/condensation protein A [Lachnospiraceae bacterium]